MSATSSLPAMAAPGKREETGLGASQGNRYVRLGTRRVHLAGVGVETGRQVESNDLGAIQAAAAGLQAEQRFFDSALQRTGAPGAQHGVDDYAGAAQQFLKPIHARIVGQRDNLDVIVPGHVHLGVFGGSSSQ